MGLPASNTERWYLHYSVESIAHTMMMRTSEGTTEGNASDAFDGFLSGIVDILAEITIIGLEVSLINSDVRNPAVWSGASTYGTGGLPDAYEPVELTFPGRSTGGHKSRVSVFGYKEPIPTDFRLSSAENASVASGVANLDAFSGRWLAIDGLAPIWHPYANVGFNDHWTKEARTSGA